MLNSHDRSLDDDEKWEAFKKGMKNATKKTHDVQDLAINGLFVLSLYTGRSDALWIEALSKFHYIFTELECAFQEKKELEDFDIPGIPVAHLMRDDVSLFLDGVPAPSQATIEWITSIRKLLKTNPKLVAPYIYHMFLGLYSGGKILRHKFKLKGEAVKLDEKANNVKPALRLAFKKLYLENPELENEFYAHSENMFRLNNQIIKECELGSNKLKVFFTVTVLCVLISAIFSWFAYFR
ncbi:unnamed protein product [Oikopleura dioica]|uniref:Heme oxygenase n=1 Tax=Oikopleura dioica TaxID=34765 RepID=E4WYQ9_OIKDI|nr:unnamed protein product [Oikopleura dioica]